MQRTIALFFSLIISFSALAEPLYWQASKGKLNYLILGSMHVGDDSMHPLPSNITTYLKHSDGLIVETDIRNNSDVTYPRSQLTSQDVLSPKQQKELSGIASLLELNSAQLLQSPPWATALAVQMKQFDYLGYQADKGIDIWLLNQASALNKPVLSLETLQFQIDLIATQENDGEELLISMIDEFDYSEDVTHCLVESWKKGDADKLSKVAKMVEMSPEFERALITDRNRDWATKLTEQKLLPKKNGNYLVVVGALHLVGEQNLIALLKQNGFKVTQRSKSQAAKCDFKL
ncbi:TraB/GumN family protein [Vibrio sp. LaRot3]|uniref:TraB/GumN family protein n=1 Tax=Vibrio sp. LaRot3 TaxID=2998829 RepID=UPI0022CE2578|nr:TraB/GumN family protein [Vibrio sp. LaRot3]MDA0149257.1 TraB/GumN family protein [Vibrio sp. LaRot3]